MQKLPWFKFSPDDWLNGDIQYCSDAAQLLFIKLCCDYWRNNCDLTTVKFRKRSALRKEKYQRLMVELEEENMICIKNDKICIKFLDEQMSQRLARSEVNALNGSKGGVAKAKRTLSERQEVAKHIEEEVRRRIEEEKEKDIDFSPQPSDPKPQKQTVDPLFWSASKPRIFKPRDSNERSLMLSEWSSLLEKYGQEACDEAYEEACKDPKARWVSVMAVDVILSNQTTDKEDDYDEAFWGPRG